MIPNIRPKTINPTNPFSTKTDKYELCEAAPTPLSELATDASKNDPVPTPRIGLSLKVSIPESQIPVLPFNVPLDSSYWIVDNLFNCSCGSCETINILAKIKVTVNNFLNLTLYLNIIHSAHMPTNTNNINEVLEPVNNIVNTLNGTKSKNIFEPFTVKYIAIINPKTHIVPNSFGLYPSI